MDNIKHSELVSLILNQLKGVTFVSLRTRTSQDKLNKGRGKDFTMLETIGIDPEKIKKHSDIVGLISGGGVSYEDFVNNRLNKEAKEAGKDHSQLTFKAGERKWGKHIKGSPALVEHKGEMYLVVYYMANNIPKVEYKYEGRIIDLTESRFDKFRKPEKEEGDNQGTEKPIVVRDYKFSSIKEITIFGNTYNVIPD